MKTKLLSVFGAVIAIAASSAFNAVSAQNTFTNKRELVLSVLDQSKPNEYVPAAFFLHFDNKLGAKAVQDHAEYIRSINTDLVKIQYEIVVPRLEINDPEDWAKVPVYDAEFFEPQLSVIEDLAKEFKGDILILPTVYSPLMLLYATAGPDLQKVISKDPAAAEKAVANLTQSVINYITAARERGADGFYISTQTYVDNDNVKAAEKFNKLQRPYDRRVSEVADSIAPFNILHICGFTGNSVDVESYADYPGSVINLPTYVGDGHESLQHFYEVFRRPIFGGLNRLGAITGGTIEEAKAEVDKVLESAPRNFILGANCTVPSDTDYDKLRAIIDYAHSWRKTHK